MRGFCAIWRSAKGDRQGLFWVIRSPTKSRSCRTLSGCTVAALLKGIPLPSPPFRMRGCTVARLSPKALTPAPLLSRRLSRLCTNRRHSIRTASDAHAAAPETCPAILCSRLEARRIIRGSTCSVGATRAKRDCNDRLQQQRFGTVRFQPHPCCRMDAEARCGLPRACGSVAPIAPPIGHPAIRLAGHRRTRNLCPRSRDDRHRRKHRISAAAGKPAAGSGCAALVGVARPERPAHCLGSREWQSMESHRTYPRHRAHHRMAPLDVRNGDDRVTAQRNSGRNNVATT